MAIGCTGGRHRSVAVAEHLARHYRESGDYMVDVAHRDIEQAASQLIRVTSAWARRMRGVIDHVGCEVTDLERSARFYDAVFYALGARRMPAEPGAVAWGVDGPVFRILAGEAQQGHMALRAAGKAAVEAPWGPVGAPAGATTDRRSRVPRTGFAATAPACATPTARGWNC